MSSRPRAPRRPSPCAVKHSRICLPTLITGFSAFIAPWGIRAICFQRMARSTSRETVVMSTPLISIRPPAIRAGGRSRPEHGHGRRRLAAAGLPDEPERLALADGEADPVHRMEGGVARPVDHVQVLDVDDGAHG